MAVLSIFPSLFRYIDPVIFYGSKFYSFTIFILDIIGYLKYYKLSSFCFGNMNFPNHSNIYFECSNK